ncbi:hypothetical protein [Ligilactobacillus araffinosus]|uniref:DUF536 domain-containing protein n=1 Tax=Ligilactobacillus araffinosus DSM 20653 TaxID=1423820 RepID=A0A0R1ZNK7_9LACO|nr:hypothetical protein [Ligilactobacillus araffinosus]KRM53046.1 hypothetical protein FC64_GL000098 [Ligilactobacillus araffinosus DSM 20653]
MSEQKEYTIKQIADELGVSKAAIQQKMTNDFRKKFTSRKKISNRLTIVINHEGYLQLKQNSKGKKDKQDKISDDVIEVLKKQLEEKDKQIEKLQVLLNQSQQLQLQQNEKIKLLETKSKNHWWQRLFK